MDLFDLFRKPIGDISYDDVRAFCAAQHREHVLVDYKRTFSSRNRGLQIAKVVASFANTQGGIVLFGVAERRNGFPETNPEGQDLGNDPRQTIRNACAQRISPPVSPDVTDFIPNPADAHRGFVVVRVPEGVYVPHTVDNFIYVRVMDSSEPKAPGLDLVTALLSRRRGLEEQEVERRTHMTERLQWAFSEATLPVVPEPRFGLWFVAGPRFGVHSPLDHTQLGRAVAKSTPDHGIHAALSSQAILAVHDGLTCIGELGTRIAALSVDVFGNSVLYDRTVTDSVYLDEANAFESQHRFTPKIDGSDENRYACVRAEALASSLEEAVRFAHSFNSRLGWRGPLVCTARIDQTKGLPLIGGASQRGAILLAKCPFDDVIERRIEIRPSDNLDAVVAELFRRVIWAWGRIDPLTIQQARELALRC